LATLLWRLTGQSGDDPATALPAFVHRDHFELGVQRFRLTVPDDVRGSRLRPSGPLVVRVESGGTVSRLAFRPEGDGARDPQHAAPACTFVADGGATHLTRPGDAVSAEVPARDSSGREWTLSWSGRVRSPLYQFERLALPPLLSPTGQSGGAGDRAD